MSNNKLINCQFPPFLLPIRPVLSPLLILCKPSISSSFSSSTLSSSSSSSLLFLSSSSSLPSSLSLLSSLSLPFLLSLSSSRSLLSSLFLMYWSSLPSRLTFLLFLQPTVFLYASNFFSPRSQYQGSRGRRGVDYNTTCNV